MKKYRIPITLILSITLMVAIISISNYKIKNINIETKLNIVNKGYEYRDEIGIRWTYMSDEERNESIEKAKGISVIKEKAINDIKRINSIKHISIITISVICFYILFIDIKTFLKRKRKDCDYSYIE